MTPTEKSARAARRKIHKLLKEKLPQAILAAQKKAERELTKKFAAKAQEVRDGLNAEEREVLERLEKKT